SRHIHSFPTRRSSDLAESDSDEQVRMVGTVKLTSGNLNIRKGPTIKDDVIGKLPNGSRVEVLEQLEDWVKIPYQGASAYVSKPRSEERRVGKESRARE